MDKGGPRRGWVDPGAHECLLRQSRQFAADGTNAAGACFIYSGREVECSGGKAGESAVVRWRNSADTWREVSRWAHGDATASGERSASVRSVKPGCCALPPRSEATARQLPCRDSGLSIL